MQHLRTTRFDLPHCAMLSVTITALAHLPPLRLVQRLDELVFGLWNSLLTDTGPLTGTSWSEAAVWLLAIAAILALLSAGTRRAILLVVLAMPIALIVLSSAAFGLAGIELPVAGPALMLALLGSLSLVSTGRLVSFKTGSTVRHRPPDAESAWSELRQLPPSEALLPRLYAIGRQLADEGQRELAAGAFLRIVQVDPDYGDAAMQLVRTAHPDVIDREDTRARLRSEMPESLGRYRLLEPVGQGATGRVYLAFDPVINRLVAVKLIDLSLERDSDEIEDARDRFLREAKTAGRLNHPNIITIYDMGESDGRAYLAMEYVKGDMLSRHTSPERLLPARLVLELAALAADGLDYAHRQNVIHRDIKPGNIMYDSVSGDLKITDFGIARLVDVKRTRTGVVLGTPSFMSPEQIEGGNVNGNTDLFALGVSLYELLTGQLPFHGTSMTKLMFVIANEPHLPLTAVRPDLPVALDPVIDTALRKDPGERFACGADMAAALRTVAGNMT